MNRFLFVPVFFVLAYSSIIVGVQAAPATSDADGFKPDSMTALTKAGWKLPSPPYPKQARDNYYQGKIYVEVFTGSNRRVSKATIVRIDKSANLASMRNAVVTWALYNWSGPPYSEAIVGLNFRLY